jgi:hypothetical protein
MAQKFVRELFFSNFCESPTNQEEDDKGRKDAADQTASAGASKKMAKPKVNQRQRRKARKAKATATALTGLPAAPTTGIGAVQKVVLPTASGRQVEVVIKNVRHYHFYRQVVAVSSVIPPGETDMSVPPPATVLSKPEVGKSLPPLQQHQAEARYPERLPLTINFGGIPKLKIPIFDGEISEYQKFRLTFNTTYDNGRNLPEQHLVSLLEMSLQGKPLKLVSDLMQMGIKDKMYACLWQLLDDRFGGRNKEDEFNVGLFKDTLPNKNGSLSEVERIYEIFLIQHAYYLTKDPASLTMEKSLLFKYGKEKLNEEFFIKFVYFAEKYKLVPNFTGLITFMQAEFLFAQKEEREQKSLSHKSNINLC